MHTQANLQQKDDLLAEEIDEIREFNHCDHIEEVADYCHHCKIFTCEDCSIDHLEHLERIDSWDSLIEEYMIQCENYDHRLRILLKLGKGPQNIRVIVEEVVNQAFERIIRKINIYRQQVKEHILSKIPKEMLQKSDESLKLPDKSKLEKALKELEKVMGDINAYKQENDKEALIKTLQKGIVKKISIMFKFDEEMKNLLAAQTKTPVISTPSLDLQIQDFLEFKKFTPFLNLSPNYLNFPEDLSEKEDLSEEFTLDGDSKMWNKGKGGGLRSYCCKVPLPEKFMTTFRVGKVGRGDRFAIIGVTGRYFERECRSLCWEEGQWGICIKDGYLHYYDLGGSTYVKRGGKVLDVKVGDLFSMWLGEERKLCFKYKGECIYTHWVIPRGTLFLAATLFNPSSQLQLTHVSRI